MRNPACKCANLEQFQAFTHNITHVILKFRALKRVAFGHAQKIKKIKNKKNKK